MEEKKTEELENNKIEEINQEEKKIEIINRNEKGQFIPGISGNPNRSKSIGRPLNLTNLLKNKLQEIPEGQQRKYKEMFIEKLLYKALIEGDFQAIKLIMNYVDGLPKQIIEGTFNNLNFDYEHLSDEELKNRIRNALAGIGNENEEEGDN